ncbi:hypothetical protein [Frankia sp. ACN1ag]|uniref:hypothetical protein n=1 Tax=Frankia sp. ACN1ag TaxID=102891 RepID=UPI0006DD05A7|nr:hypothetical protein [Frankia sp. ACN1ag]KQC38997.1 hypothetical protein UK82_07300 [Frankia sp. ACN1ag]
MSPAPVRPIGAIDPAELHRVLLWAHNQAAGASGGFTAQRAADRLHASVAGLTAAFDVLATQRTRHGLSIYYRAGLDDLTPAGCRPPARISRRELWAAVAGVWRSTGNATTQTIAVALDAPAGPVDRTWLALRLATWTAAELLALTNGHRWTLTRAGLARAEQVRTARLGDGEAWAAIAAEHLDRPINPDAVARRLGITLPRFDEWTDQAVRAGALARAKGGALVLTIAGRLLLGAAAAP